MTSVAVVGAGLTGLAAAYRLARAGARVTVLDAADRPGGLLRSERVDGWLVEWAAHGFLDDAPDTLALAAEVGLADELVRAAPAAKDRFLAHGKRLVRAPARPQDVITSPLLGPKAKLRLLREPKAPPRPPGLEDETVAAFARRRFGDGVLHLVDAFVTGVYAGDAERLALEHAFPRLAEMEREHGSVLRAMRARGRRRLPRPRLASFRDGMEALPRALAAALPPEALRLGTRVASVRARGDGGFALDTDAGSVEADRVLLALPPSAVGALVEGADVPPVATAPVAVVALGYPARAAKGARGFGYLAPEREGRFALGALYESNLFPGRAPDGHALVRALVGGVRHPERAALPDDALVAGVAKDLAALGAADGEPVFAHVARPGGIPQPEVGHGKVLAAAARLEAERPGLVVAGAGWRGVAVNALVADAEAAAARVLGER